MKINVKIKPNSKKEEIKKIDDKNFIVAVKEPPVEGKANKALLQALKKVLLRMNFYLSFHYSVFLIKHLLMGHLLTFFTITNIF